MITGKCVINPIYRQWEHFRVYFIRIDSVYLLCIVYSFVKSKIRREQGSRNCALLIIVWRYPSRIFNAPPVLHYSTYAVRVGNTYRGYIIACNWISRWKASRDFSRDALDRLGLKSLRVIRRISGCTFVVVRRVTAQYASKIVEKAQLYVATTYHVHKA